MRERIGRGLREVTALWRRNGAWWWRHRLRFADWFYAAALFPFTALAQVTPDLGLLDGPIRAILPANTSMLYFLAMAHLTIAPAVLVSFTVLFRRTRPHPLLAVAFFLLLGFGNIFPAMFALYTYAVHFTDRRLLTGWFALLAFAMVTGLGLGAVVFLINLVFFLVVPMTVGLWVGTRRQLIDRLEERAERLEREQHLMADRAITAERTRIAREMHDVVAHRVSLMVLHAGGLEVSAADERTAEAAGLIRTTGREALSELRGILGVLREDTGAAAPTAPQPGLADLERLVGEWRDAGLEVVRADSGAVRELPGRIQRTAFRVVQEGLTNAAKHASGARVAVELHFGTDTLVVEVGNGPAGPSTPPPPHSGYGLAGLRERVALAGGSLEAGPRFDGGWRLRAMLPVGGTPPSAAEGGATGDPHGPGR